MFPATALVASPVDVTLISPERREVTTNQAMRPAKNPIHGAKIAAMVDIRPQRRIKPTGMAAPPTIIPSTVRSHVRLIDAALRMQQNAARTRAYKTIP